MIKPQKGKIVVNLVENIRGEKLKHFINFCFSISDEVILGDEFSAHMLKDEAKEAIYKSSTRFEKMGMSIEEINERIADSQERIEQIGSSYAISQDKIEVLKDKYLVQYGLKKREVTCETHCTLGGEKIQYYFTSEGNIKAKFEKMQTLYDRIILAKEEFELDDPAFCKDGEVICSICSHEHMGSLVLTQEQYQVFRQLRIPHDAANINDIKEEKVTLDPIILGGIAYYPLEGENNTKVVKKSKAEINDKREELILTLNKLKVVSISEIDQKKLTPKLKAFLEKLKPKNPWDYII